MSLFRRARYVALFLVFALLVPATSMAGTVTVTASADTFVDDSAQSANNGTLTKVSTDGSPLNHGILRFAIPELAGEIVSAEVRMTVDTATYSETADGPAIYTTSDTWTETGVTWANQPSSITLLDDVGALGSGSVATYDVTAAVTGSGNVNFKLKQPGTDGTTFRSREATSGRPQLVITTADALTVTASADAHVNETATSTNYGTSTTLSTDESPGEKAMLRFSIPEFTGSVVSAEVRLTVDSASGSSTVDGPAIYTTTDTWTETGVTWLNQPETITMLDDVGALAVGSVATYDVTAAVTGSGSVSFKLKQPGLDGTDFRSREASSGQPQLVITTGTPDTTAPTAPTALEATASSSSSIDLDWTAATDNRAVTSYVVYRGSTAIASVMAPTTSYADTGLTASTSYTYKVYAKDAAGNTSAASSTDTATTMAGLGGWVVGEGASVAASFETDPVLSSGDAADDPAIWVNPSNPAESRIIGTDKLDRLEVYDLDGDLRQAVELGQPVNVDLRDDFTLNGDTFTLVTTGDRADNTLQALKMDSNGVLTHLASLPLEVGVHSEGPYGMCMYRSPSTAKVYAFVNYKNGKVHQYHLWDNNGTLAHTKVRSFDIDPMSTSDQVEGCVADDQLGRFYIGEEDVAVYRYGAEPGAGSTRTTVASVGTNLTADIEGLTLTYAPGDAGHLIVSSQGNNTFTLYRRDTNAYATRFTIAGDGCQDSDGIDATAAPLGSLFPQGLFVCQDGYNQDASTQNFKLVQLNRIATYSS